MRRSLSIGLFLAFATTSGMIACPSATPAYVPRDRALASLPLFFYPAVRGPARAVLVFFGNDVGFWKAHEELAERLADRGYDVIGVDVRKYIDLLPDDVTARERAFATSIRPLIARAVAELGADSLALILGGHSFGADLACWTALHAPPPRLVGVLALSPTARSHFYVTVEDLANIKDPEEPGSFSVADQIRALPPALRVALVRGAHDPRRGIDSALSAAGGKRLRYTVVPLAGHSLKSLTITGPMIARAVDWLATGH